MRLWNLVFLLLTIPIEVFGQLPCPQAPVLGKPDGENIFDDQQEVFLGEVVAESMAHSIRVIEEEELVAPLIRIGDRILRQMPQSRLNHRFFLIDDPQANAVALPGGRVYVTSKLVTGTRSEDELAGVLAHEIGHQLKHDSAVLLTKQFKKWLQISSMGNREDIENKYHQLLDSYRTHGSIDDIDKEKEQLDADQVAIFAMARAGYDPQAVVDFWDRFTERKGRKGNWFSDFFGATAPETKRLREFANTASQIPSECRDSTHSISIADFENWKSRLLQYKGFGKKEDIPGLQVKRTLEPPLSSEIKHFGFSHDGRYLLAQDDASIFVLQHEPLEVLFRIDARDAESGHFTPDSSFLVFHDKALQVHKWSIAEQREIVVDDVYVYRGCLSTQLSPDGSVLACFKTDSDNFFPIDIRLIDVATGEVIHEKKNFIKNTSRTDLGLWFLFLDNTDIFAKDFSGDGRYFLAGISSWKWGYDLQEKRELKLPGSVKSIMESSFAFLDSDRLIGVDGTRGYNSKIVQIPGGKVLQSGIQLGPVKVQAAKAGEFVVVRPLIETPAGIMDLKQNKIFLASKTEALDIYNGVWVDERTNGEVALYRRPLTKPIAAVTLPRSPLSPARASVFSPDLNLIAVSNRTRGMIWDLSKGGSVMLEGFLGAYFDSSDVLINFAPRNLFRKLRTEGVSEKELRKEEGKQQGNTIARIDMLKLKMTEISRYQKRDRVYQIGSTYAVLIPKKPEDDPDRDVTLELHDFHSSKLLWSRFFKRMYWLGWNPAEDIVIMIWELTEREAKDEIEQDPVAARLTESILEKKGSYLVVALDARTGKPITRFPIDTGKASYQIVDCNPTGDYIVFLDSNDRTLVYNIKGKRVGRFFGIKPAVSSKTGMLAVEREPGRIALYDIATMSNKREFTFDSEVEYTQFSADGCRLAVLTRRQEVCIIDLSDLVQSTSN